MAAYYSYLAMIELKVPKLAKEAFVIEERQGRSSRYQVLLYMRSAGSAKLLLEFVYQDFINLESNISLDMVRDLLDFGINYDVISLL